MKTSRIFIALTLTALPAAIPLPAQDTPDYELPPVSYSASTPTNAISRLEARIASGEFKPPGGGRESLNALLKELKVPAESQVLVFSKTSLQTDRIRPDRPRAIYFSDTCYIGWVPGGLIEIADIDPVLGPVFYTFNPYAEAPGPRPRFNRDNDCLRCHAGSLVRHFPSVFARSVFADADGQPLLRHGYETVDHTTPFTDRWGGWYVTGRHGKALHRGNVFAGEKGDELVADFSKGANLTNLADFFFTDRYPARTSDITALLVMEHQMAMQNAITRAAFRCRRMLDYQKSLQRDLKEPVTDEPTFDSVKTVFDGAVQELVDHLLFKDEAPLPDGIEGSAEFQRAFLANARRAANGASLKDLRLKERIFENRCSHLIYSASFLALPEQLKRRVYGRLAKALHPTEPDPRHAHIGAEERARIVAILRETHPELRAGPWPE